MKKIILMLTALCLVLSLGGCGEKKRNHEEIGNQITNMDGEITSIVMVADDYYKQGVIDDNLHDTALALMDELTEIKDMYDATEDYDKDEAFSQNLMTLDEKKNEIKSRLEDAMGNIADTAVYASNLLDMAKEMEAAINEAAAKGTLDSKRVEEYKGYLTELEGMTAKASDDIAVKSRLIAIKQELAVLASQASADNTIDKLNALDESQTQAAAQAEQGTAEPTTEAQAKASDAKTNAADFIAAYTLLQNEASRKVELGDFSEEDYAKLLNLGVKVAEVKETDDKGENTDERIAELKPQLYEIAQQIGFTQADLFK